MHRHRVRFARFSVGTAVPFPMWLTDLDCRFDQARILSGTVQWHRLENEAYISGGAMRCVRWERGRFNVD